MSSGSASGAGAAWSPNLEIDSEELSFGRLLGNGGFGQVWSGLWRGTPVAIKLLTGRRRLSHHCAASPGRPASSSSSVNQRGRLGADGAGAS